MKIKRLRIVGFGPYKNEQLIDFERFDADGIFLITGKTGAGKSSILDAICFALYGSVPRYEGTESQLRSDHCEPDDPTSVELEFGMNEQTYRIYRTPKYDKAKKRGTGTTPSQADARLDVRDGAVSGAGGEPGDGWRTLAARPVDVGHELARILPLKQDQFLQVILLAQNRFQRFLLARTEDRRAVLRTLFGTARFEQLETELLARRKALDAGLATVQQNIAGLASTVARQLQRGEAAPEHPDLAWFDAAQAELEVELIAATGHAERAAASLAAATARHQAQQDLRRLQDRRDAAAARLDALAVRRESIAAERAGLRAATRAARVWPQARARQEADAALDAALAAEAAARLAWQGLRSGALDAHATPETLAAPETHDSLGVVIADLLGRLGALADVLADEQRLPGLDEDIAERESRLAESAAALGQAQQRIDALPEQIDEVDRRLAEAALAAGRGDDVAAAVLRAETALTAAGQVRRLEADLAAAHLADKAAAGENTQAAVRYEALVDRRLGGHAFELASQLVDGEPCLVCGSTVHPAPTASDEEPVTEGDIEAARSVMAERQAALEQAHTAVLNVTTRLAEARARAGDKTVGELEAEAAAALSMLEAARTAVDLERSLGDRKSILRAELDQAQGGLAAVRADRDDVAAGLAERRSRRAMIAERVAAQRGSCDSVTQRVDRLRAELDAAEHLDDALDRTRERQGARATTGATLVVQLAEEGFESEEAASAARIPGAELDRREAALRDFDDEVAAALAVLGEPELTGLPGDVVDLATVRAELAAANAERDAALAVQGSLGERADLLGGLVADAREHFVASTELLDTQVQVQELAAVVHGDEPNTKRMRLETYVLAAQLEEIIAAANNRLRTMTGGRYTLEHDDSLQYRGTSSGLGLAIRDEHTGRARPTHSLSGGETFLASLALALGLAEVVSNQAGGIALDTLFVDEGFGSLDSETLETAMSTLDGLRAGGRTIGLISHVDSMKEQIPARLGIIVTDAGYSEIEGSYALA
jgi:exonuclease SbcC